MIPIYLNIADEAKIMVNKNVSYMFELLDATCGGLSYEEVLDSIFPMYIIDTNIDKCIKAVKELWNMSKDKFERDCLSAFHEWTLYHTILWWIDVADDIKLDIIPRKECISTDGTNMYEYLNKVENCLDFLFADWDFLSLEEIYALYKKKPKVLESFLHIDIEKYIELMPADIQEEYKMQKERKQGIMENKRNMTLNVSGGQVNIANDNATINATQNNGVAGDELEKIIEGIKASLSGLKKEDADEIIDVVDMAQNELRKPEPKLSRLRNCLTLIAPMITIANGMPTLVSNLQKLQEFIMQYIK